MATTVSRVAPASTPLVDAGPPPPDPTPTIIGPRGAAAGPVQPASTGGAEAGSPSRGTLSVIEAEKVPPEATTAPDAEPTAAADPIALPAAASARPTGAGAIGPDPSASSPADEQPRSVAPGTGS
jgi:hypothetical protein